MIKHSDRTHAVWSASSTAANWTCAGRMAMVSISPDDKKSIYAAEGTAAHEVAERALRGDLDCSKFLGEVYSIDGFDVEVTEELARSAQTYVHYVASQTDVAAGSVLLIEERHSLAQLNPPFNAGGTCDATIIKPHLGEIEVVDLKNGRGIVEVNGNKQTRTYALLALLNAPKDLVNQIDQVKVTIVQPRAPHKDGRIRSETFHIAELIEWTSELLKAMNRSALALEEFNMINGSRTMFDEWASAQRCARRPCRWHRRSRRLGLKTPHWRHPLCCQTRFRRCRRRSCPIFSTALMLWRIGRRRCAQRRIRWRKAEQPFPDTSWSKRSATGSGPLTTKRSLLI